MPIIQRILQAAAATLVLVSASVSAHGTADHPARKTSSGKTPVAERTFGREGNPKQVKRVIQVDMSDNMRFTPSLVTVRRGDTVKFVIRNSGKVLHEMVLGTTEELKSHAELMRKFPEMEHEDANMAHVQPGKNGEIVWQFTRPGEYQFACLIPGHFEAGMVGTVRVE